MSPEESKMEAEMIGLLNRSTEELFKFSRPAGKATFEKKENWIYQYNVAMLSKYCLLRRGAMQLLDDDNYYSFEVLRRSLLEIKAHLRYFYKNQGEIKEFVHLSKQKKNRRPKKFSQFNIIVNGAENEADGKVEYEMYSYLCSVQHPSFEPFILLSASSKQKKLGAGKGTIYHTRFTPEPNKDSRINALFGLLKEDIGMLNIQRLLLKRDDLESVDLLLQEGINFLNKTRVKMFMNQKGVKEQIGEYKQRRVKELETGKG